MLIYKLLKWLCFTAPVLCFAVATHPLYAQVKGKLKIEYSAPSLSLTRTTSNGIITCIVKERTFKKTDTGLKFFFYARNDVRNLPMELQQKRKSLPAKWMKSKINNKDNVVFSVKASDIFFTEEPDNGYNWRWRGRARAPLSPVVDVNGEAVKKIDCWFALVINKQAYISDTISIQVQ